VKLRLQLSQLGDMRDRLESARIELATSQAGFKYQYALVRPAQIPKRPVKPNVPAIIIAGVLASLMLAVASAIGADLAGGRILESWQVERLAGTPVLARLTLS
jgi:hypothetical protein